MVELVDCGASRFEKCLASVGGSKTRGLDFLLGYSGSSVCSTVPGSGWVSIARQTEDLFTSRTRWVIAVGVVSVYIGS
jgi:hypothetical protein